MGRYYGDIIVDIDFASEKARQMFENLEHRIKNIKKYVKECKKSSNRLSIHQLLLRCRFCTYDDTVDSDREKLERELKISKIAKKVTPFGRPILDPGKIKNSNCTSTSSNSPTSDIFVTHC